MKFLNGHSNPWVALLIAAIIGWHGVEPILASETEEKPPLRMNQIQVIGTHNSYHLRKGEKPAHPDWDYAHPPLEVQLGNGVRSFELDLYRKADGWHVMHVPLLDDASSCPRLADCLTAVRKWSKEHPKHVTISFLCEIKEEGMKLDRTIMDFDAAAADSLDAEIRLTFVGDELITPDRVRGDKATLAEGARAGGWPTLGESRGKVFFILHEQGKFRDVYVEGRPSLQGRAMFIRSEEGREDCATLVEDTPDVERIRRLVRAGYWVRTRADGNLRPGLAPAGATRAEAALMSGAQIVSTDSPPGEPKDDGTYIGLPGNAAARVNPVFDHTATIINE